MERQPVKSSHLISVGYEDGSLQIEFWTGEVYTFSNVPEDIFEGLLAASSKGAYFHKTIRNSFNFTKS